MEVTVACGGNPRQWLWSVHGLTWSFPQVDRHVDLLQVAKETDGFSGSDLKEMCRDAALLCVREYVNNACEEDVYVGPCCTLTAAPCVPWLIWDCVQGHTEQECPAFMPNCHYTQTPPHRTQLLLFLLALKMSSALCCSKVPELEVP